MAPPPPPPPTTFTCFYLFAFHFVCVCFGSPWCFCFPCHLATQSFLEGGGGGIAALFETRYFLTEFLADWCSDRWSAKEGGNGSLFGLFGCRSFGLCCLLFSCAPFFFPSKHSLRTTLPYLTFLSLFLSHSIQVSIFLNLSLVQTHTTHHPT